MQHEREFGFATRALHAGNAARPGDRLARRPDLPDGCVRLRLDRAGGGALRVARVTATFTAASAIPRSPRSRSAWPASRAALGAIAFSSGLAAQLCTVLTLAQAGDHLVCTQNVYGGTVTQLSVTVKRMGIETTFRPGRRSRRGARRDSSGERSCSSSRRSATRRASSPTCALSRARARGRHPAGRRQHVRDAVSLPADRARRRHRRSTRRRSSSTGTARRSAACWSNPGSFRGANGRFPLLSEPSPGYHRKSLHRDVRRVRLSDARARRSLARRRRADVADGCVADAARSRDARAAHGAPRRATRARSPRFLRIAPGGRVGSRPASSGRSSPSACAAAAKRDGASSTRSSSGATSPTSATAKSLVIHPASTTHSQLSDDELRKAGVEPESGAALGRPRRTDDLIWDLDNALRVGGPRPCGARTRRMILTTPSQRRESARRASQRSRWSARSSNPLRPSYTVFSYLRRRRRYDVTPINPTIDADRRQSRLSVAAGLRGRARRPRCRRRLSQPKRTRRGRERRDRRRREGDLVSIRRRQRRSDRARRPSRAERRRRPLHEGRARALSRRPLDERD